MEYIDELLTFAAVDVDKLLTISNAGVIPTPPRRRRG